MSGRSETLRQRWQEGRFAARNLGPGLTKAWAEGKFANRDQPPNRRMIEWTPEMIAVHHEGKAKGWTQQSIAARVGVCVTTYRYWLQRSGQ